MMPIFSNPEISYAAKNVEYKIANRAKIYEEGGWMLDIDYGDYMDNRDLEKIKGDEKVLNELGKEGWELIWIEREIMVFKR